MMNEIVSNLSVGWLTKRTLIFLFFLLISPILASHDQYWDDYQKDRRLGLCKTVVEYVDRLATYNQNEALDYKKQALTYFFAKGGKGGFSKRKATPQEQETLTKAVMFLTLLHCYQDYYSAFNILTCRRALGAPTETDKEKGHLVAVQRLITATHMLVDDGEDLEGTQSIYDQEYVPVCASLGKPFFQTGGSRALWKQCMETFCKPVTIKLKTYVRDLWDEFFVIRSATQLQASLKQEEIMQNPSPWVEQEEVTPQPRSSIKQEGSTHLKPSSSIQQSKKVSPQPSYEKREGVPQSPGETSVPRLLKYSQKIIEIQTVPLSIPVQDDQKTDETSFDLLFYEPETSPMVQTERSQEKVQSFLKKSLLKSQEEKSLEKSQYSVIGYEEDPTIPGDWKCPIF